VPRSHGPAGGPEKPPRGLLPGRGGTARPATVRCVLWKRSSRRAAA